MQIAETSTVPAANPASPPYGSEPAARGADFSADLLLHLIEEMGDSVGIANSQAPEPAGKTDSTELARPLAGTASTRLKPDLRRERLNDIPALVVDPSLPVTIPTFRDLSSWFKQSELPSSAPVTLPPNGPELANISSARQAAPDLSFAAQLTLSPPDQASPQRETPTGGNPVPDRNTAPVPTLGQSSNFEEPGGNDSTEESPKTLQPPPAEPTSVTHTPFTLVPAQTPPSPNPAKPSVPSTPVADLHETHSPRVAPPLKEIGLKIDVGLSSGVSLQLAERPGGLHVAVRTHDPDLGRSLQSNLTDLVSSLKHEGVDADTWTPAEAHMDDNSSGAGSTNPGKEQSHAEGQGRSAGEGTTQHNSSGRKDNPQRNRRPDWVRSLDASFLATFTN